MNRIRTLLLACLLTGAAAFSMPACGPKQYHAAVVANTTLAQAIFTLQDEEIAAHNAKLIPDDQHAKNKAVMGKLMQKKNVRQHYGSNTPVHFNEKELKILQLLSEDKTTEEISKIIFLSPRTIETIRQNMKTKVDAKTIGGLIMYGMRNKLIE